jgi:hypothetical protein
VHALEDFARARDIILVALYRDAIAARRNIYAQPVFDQNEVGIKLAKQRAQYCRLVKLQLCSGPARRVGAARVGAKLRHIADRLVGGAELFAGHALLFCNSESGCSGLLGLGYVRSAASPSALRRVRGG